jgi:2-polyprenyl-3-methyl-5-hydroxy-6-metoxy-1,4-benzoquinol methylase
MSLENEIKFHNSRFSNGKDGRKLFDGFYKITFNSKLYFKKTISSSIYSGCNILELGSGNGSENQIDDTKSYCIKGIDISEAGILEAKKNSLANDITIEYSLSDAHSTNFDSNYFDVVYGSGIIHHLDISLVSKELARILKNDGFCFFYEPMAYNPFVQIFRFLTPHLRTKDEHPLKLNDFSIMSIYFKNVDIKYFHLISLFSLLFIKNKHFISVHNFLSDIDEFLIKKIPSIAKYSWICVIKLSMPLK